MKEEQFLISAKRKLLKEKASAYNKIQGLKPGRGQQDG